MTPKLQEAIRLAQHLARTAGIEDIADPAIETDPENPADWWVSIAMKATGTVQQVFDLYQKFMKQFTACIDPRERKRIRIELSL